MGMYCCCDQKIKDGWKCLCSWKGWNSCYDYPPERRNKNRKIREFPEKEGLYLVRYCSQCADRYEDEQTYSFTPRSIRCGYTGKELIVHWSGNYEEQPYAWKEIN